MTEPVADAGPTSFLGSLGERGQRRAEPRTSIAIAGAGCALGILGVLVVAGDTGLDEASGDFNKVPGIVLSALVVAAGFFVLASARRGAIATAGTVAAALGVPAFMCFLTVDQDSLPPYSSEGILIVSTGVWLTAYAVGPGRGRPFFLGSGLIGFWLTVLQVTENVFDAPFDGLGFSVGGSSSSFESTGEIIDPSTSEINGSGDFSSGFGDDGFGGGSSFEAPDAATIGMLSLGLGVAFLLAGRWLDRSGRHGVATPFALAALPCLFVGVLGLAPDLEAAGSGLLTVVIGLGLVCHGASVWRRATTWIGGGATALGLAIFLADMADDDVTIAGMLFIAGGIGLVFAGHAIATAIHEPGEMETTFGMLPAGAGPNRHVTPLVTDPPAPAPLADENQWAPPASPPIPPPPAPSAADTDDHPPIPPPPPA